LLKTFFKIPFNIYREDKIAFTVKDLNYNRQLGRDIFINKPDNIVKTAAKPARITPYFFNLRLSIFYFSLQTVKMTA